jgi:hypothetical protein
MLPASHQQPLPVLCLQGFGMMVSPSGSPERAGAHPIQTGFRRNHNGGGQVGGFGGLVGQDGAVCLRLSAQVSCWPA